MEELVKKEAQPDGSGEDLSALDDNGELDAWLTMDDAEAMLEERDIGEDMAVKWKKETLLPMQIWIDEAFGYKVRGNQGPGRQGGGTCGSQ